MLILLGNQDNEQHLRGALEISVNGKKKKKVFFNWGNPHFCTEYKIWQSVVKELVYI